MTEDPKASDKKAGTEKSTPIRKLSPDGVPYEDVKDEKGRRYVIPNLRPSDEKYLEKYANMMYLKFHNPRLFNKVMSWD